MAALLTPQGKLLYDFLIYVEDEALLIDCEAAEADALAKKLSLYKLRADVTIEATDLRACAVARRRPTLPANDRLLSRPTP